MSRELTAWEIHRMGLTKVPDCKYAETKAIQKECCGEVKVLYCSKFQKFTSLSQCAECKDRETP